MSYNTSRYLNYLTAVEALTAVQRATIDDVNPLAAYTLHAGSYEWVSTPIGAGGTAYEQAWHDLVAGGILGFMPHFLNDQKRPVADILVKNGPRLPAVVASDPGRVKFGFHRALNAVLLKDFADRAAAATTVYAPVEALIPFASL